MKGSYASHPTQQEQGNSVHANVTESEKLIKTKKALLFSFPRLINTLLSNLKKASLSCDYISMTRFKLKVNM